MKLFGLSNDQLKPVANGVRAAVVPYKKRYQKLLRRALPRFLGDLGAAHGASYPQEHLDAVVAAIDAKEVEVDFLVVALNACRRMLLAGLATGSRTFGVEWDENGSRRVVPIWHGEDRIVDRRIRKLFRQLTRCPAYPNGMGAGTWFMGEQIQRFVSNPQWVYGGCDNEHKSNNFPMIGVMNNFGSIPGTEEDSAVLQLDGIPYTIKPRFGVTVKTEALPADALGITKCPNNFLTRWESKDGKQEIVVIFTKMASTFDGRPIVWTKIKSHGKLPEGEMLQEILTSLISAGCEEIASPERRWGSHREEIVTGNGSPHIPVLGSPQEIEAALKAARREGFLGQLPQGIDLSRALGGPVPIMHIHLNNEPEILEALLARGAVYREFGDSLMVSGDMRLKYMKNPEAKLGKPVPEATDVNGILVDEASEPIFDFLRPEIIRVGASCSTQPR